VPFAAAVLYVIAVALIWLIARVTPAKSLSGT
jgi:hypothetical protein